MFRDFWFNYIFYSRSIINYNFFCRFSFFFIAFNRFVTIRTTTINAFSKIKRLNILNAWKKNFEILSNVQSIFFVFYFVIIFALYNFRRFFVFLIKFKIFLTIEKKTFCAFFIELNFVFHKFFSLNIVHVFMNIFSIFLATSKSTQSKSSMIFIFSKFVLKLLICLFVARLIFSIKNSFKNLLIVENFLTSVIFISNILFF